MFANRMMYLKGYRLAETIISYKRDASLHLHCKCGYAPQKAPKKWALKSNFFNRMFGFDRLTIKKAEKVYQSYLNTNK